MLVTTAALNDKVEQRLCDATSALHACISAGNDVSDARHMMRDVSTEDRRHIVCTQIDGCQSLLLAANCNRLDYVTYLVNECGADVEQRGVACFTNGRARTVVSEAINIVNMFRLNKIFLSEVII